MDNMTPKERIWATINRQPVDRPPVDLWCTPEVLDSLRKYTSLQDEMAVYNKLGIDKIVWIFPGYGGRFFDPNDSGEITMWGVPTRMVKAGLATYQEYINPPIADYMDPSQLAGYHSWPDPDKFDYAGAKRFTPYVFLGLGVTYGTGNEAFFGPNIPLGVGVKYKIKNRINLGCEFSFRKLFGDKFDVTNGDNAMLDNPYQISGSFLKNKDWYSFLLLSVTWDFGPRNRPCNSINSNSTFRY